YGTSGLFGEPRAREAPSVGAEFASETSAHYGSEHTHFVGGVCDLRPHHFARNAADILSRRINRQIVAIPFRHLAVRFEAAMGDDRNSILALARHLGLLQGLVRIPVGLFGEHTKQLAEQTDGNPDQALQQAEVTSEGEYGVPVITHCCLEAHGQVAEWDGDNLTIYASTQNVSGIPGEMVRAKIADSADKVRVLTPVMGGGFGSKFSADTWGLACARLAKKEIGRASCRER